MAQRPHSSGFAWLPWALLTVLLAVSGLGYVHIKGDEPAITVLHVPVIAVGLCWGVLPALVLGLIFGFSNFLQVSHPDMLVQVVPRAACGVVAALVFLGIRRSSPDGSQLTLGAFCGAVAGSLTNTVGLATLACYHSLLSPELMLSTIVFHTPPEALLAVAVCVPLVVSRGRGPSKN